MALFLCRLHNELEQIGSLLKYGAGRGVNIRPIKEADEAILFQVLAIGMISEDFAAGRDANHVGAEVRSELLEAAAALRR